MFHNLSRHSGWRLTANYAPLCFLSTAGTPNEALEDMLEAMQDYAAEYLEELAIYQNAPNRGHHLPYIQAIAACKDAWDIRMLIEIQHGRIQVSTYCSQFAQRL